MTVKIIGVGQDVDTTGAKVGFTFQLTDGLKYDRPVNMQMNSSNTTSGGWQSCLMRSTNLPKIKDALPAELKAKLKKVKKKTNMTGSGTATVETEDDLFLLSFKEVFGDAQGYASDGSHNWLKEEGEWYQWYQQHNTNADRVIKQAGGSANGWWLRSIYSSSRFCGVNISGAWGYDYANNDYLPCAGLCI